MKSSDISLNMIHSLSLLILRILGYSGPLQAPHPVGYIIPASSLPGPVLRKSRSFVQLLELHMAQRARRVTCPWTLEGCGGISNHIKSHTSDHIKQAKVENSECGSIFELMTNHDKSNRLYKYRTLKRLGLWSWSMEPQTSF